MSTSEAAPPGERIAKRIARAGLCSRREAERWIEQGRVAVDGVLLTTPAFTVTKDNKVMVDGRPLPAAQETRLWRYHKPPGLVTTNRDELGRDTIFDHLPKNLPRVLTVGRLDLNSEGLLLLTNDGDLARKLELPATGWTRRYRVRVYGRVDQAKLNPLKRGVTIEGVGYDSIVASVDKQQGSNAWLTVSLREGKNREIRRVMEHLGWPVSRLIRLAYGPFQLGNLKAGAVEPVPHKVLREQLGQGR
jgi:23S rRNA pseudouridine2605 synthase